MHGTVRWREFDGRYFTRRDMMQGRSDTQQWVTRFALNASTDGVKFITVDPASFSANSDATLLVTNELLTPPVARCACGPCLAEQDGW